ncbi:MAG: AAA family ATPase, partial [Shewanella sp.]
MMQIDQRIIIIANACERLQRLTHILEFLGERVEVIAPEQLSTLASETRFRGVIVCPQSLPLDAMQAYASAVPWQPMLMMFDAAGLTHGHSNILG